MRVDFSGLSRCGAAGEGDALLEMVVPGALDSLLDCALAGALDKMLDAALGDLNDKSRWALDETLGLILIGVWMVGAMSGVLSGVAGRKLRDALASSGLGASVSRMIGVRRAFRGA